jgi:acyl-coenzyme A thioesterase 13
MSNDPPPTTSPEKIKGNASEATKELLSNPAHFFQGRRELRSLPVFGDDIMRKVIATEANIVNKREDEQRKEAIVVFELHVTEG